MVNILARVKEKSECYKCNREFTVDDDVVLNSSWHSPVTMTYADCNAVAEAEKLKTMQASIDQLEAKKRKLEEEKVKQDDKQKTKEDKTKQ